MKKNYLLLFLFSLLLLFGCSKKKDDNLTNPPKEEAKVVSIKTVSRSGKTITEDSVFVSDTEIYSHNDIYVWAIYSDESWKDVTPNSSFSNIDITTVGDKTVEVSYLEFKTTYILHVLENNVSSLIVDTTNCNLLYEVGSIFSGEGLSVRANYADGTTKTIEDYSLSIKNSDKNINRPFTEPGYYNITVGYAGHSKDVKILVYERKYNNSYTYKMDYILNDIYLGENDSFTFYQNVHAINNSILKMDVNKTTLYTKEANGDDVNLEYNKEKYNSYLSIPTSDGIEITLYKQTAVFLLAGSLSNTAIYFKNSSNKIETFGHINKNVSVLYCLLDAGTYNIVASKNNSRLYSLTFDSYDLSINDLNIDTTNVKTDYRINENFTLDGIKVYYVLTDGSTSLVDLSLVSYKIYDSNNNLTNNLSRGGIYNVEISVGNLSKTYQINVLDDRVFNNIVLNKDYVKLTFYDEDFSYDGLRVYGSSDSGNVLLNENNDYIVELLFNGNVVNSFSSYGSYTVRITYIGSGCNNNITSYNVNYSKTIKELCLDTTNVKLNYNIGENLDINQLIIKLKYLDDTTFEINSNQVEKYIYFNDILVNELNEIGTYKILIKYGNYSSSYNINVNELIIYNSIECDSSETKLNFIGENFNINNLKIYGNAANGSKILIPLIDLDIKLLLNDIIVDDFTVSGTYNVNITYIGDIECEDKVVSYSVVYTANQIYFSYSGPNVGSFGGYQMELTYPLDYRSYIRVPNDNYIFGGFSYPFGDITKVYVNLISNRTVYYYVSPRYEYISFNYEGHEPTPEHLNPDETFIRYELDTTLSTSKYKLYYAVCSKNTVEASISILNTDSVNISFNNIVPRTVNAVVTDSDGNTINITQNNQVLESLDPNKIYKLSGSLTVDNIVYSIKEVSFSTSYVRQLASLSSSDTLLNVSSSTLEIDCRPYVNLAPNGYNVCAVQLLDENNEVKKEIMYDGSQTVYFTNLDENTTYYVAICYQQNQLNQYSLEEDKPKYTYHFRFIGYFVLTHGDKNYRVRMQYLGETLYTWYLSDRNWYTSYQLCNFTLPYELLNYKILGCKERLYNISQDMDVEIILVKKDTKYVTFYGFQDQLLSYYEYKDGEQIKYPSYDNSVNYNGWIYEFVEWYDYGDNVYKANYQCTSNSSLFTQNYTFFIFDNKLCLTGSLRCYPYSVDYIERIYDKYNNDITSSLSIKSSPRKEFSGLNPNTEYIFKGTLIYNLNDGNGNQYKTYEYKFKTMSQTASKNIIISVNKSNTTLNSISFSANKNNFDAIVVDYINGFTYFNNDYLNINTFDLGLVEGNELFVYYADKKIENDVKVFNVYSQAVKYSFEQEEDVLLESVELVIDKNNFNNANFIIKGKNVSKVNLFINLNIKYFEFTDNNKFIFPMLSKIVSDDEVVFTNIPFKTDFGDEYEVEDIDLFSLSFYIKNKSYYYNTELLEINMDEENLTITKIYNIR